MKNDKANKFIVFVAIFLLSAVFVLLMLAAWGVIDLGGFANYLADGPAAIRVLLGIVFLAAFCFCVFAMICSFKIGKALAPSEMNLLKQTGGGTSYISSDAVSGMIQRVLKADKRIKSGNCRVNPVEDGITADIKLTAFSGGDLAELCSDIQGRVKTEIEGATGIPVRNVAVSIVQTVESGTPQIEKRVN